LGCAATHRRAERRSGYAIRQIKGRDTRRRRSEPHKYDPTAAGTPGVDGISFTVHPVGMRNTVHPPGSPRTARQAGILVDDKRRPDVRREVQQLRPDNLKLCTLRQHGGAPPSAPRRVLVLSPAARPCSPRRRLPRPISPSRVHPPA
jgi:hypothetical protein